jgi:asparagine synthase (glutamine-hydrolysing)
MCGIIGYVGRDAPSLEGRVRAARDEMTHRGPDDAGLWHDANACLGTRRLAILDLSPAGHMPMTSADARHVIVFNGAIYNYVELRAKLERTVAFRSTGDTEVILNGFRVWGWSGLLDRLDGMFAIAIWDAGARQLYAARDRLGEKPFFFARMNGGFAFASTLTALATLRGGARRVDARALDAYLTYQAVPAPFSIFEGCKQLPPAHELRFDAARGELRVTRYWDVAYAPKRRVTERDAVDTIDAMTRASVRQRLRSDVPTGTLLSGGVDSSLITAIASQENGAPIDAVTMGYEGPEVDERAYARLVASQHGVRLHEEILAPSVVRDLPAIIWQYGQPLADISIVPNYYLAAAARRYMTVALVGDGADEAFGGYSRPMVERVAPFYRRMLPHSVRLGLSKLFTHRNSAHPLRRRLALLARDGSVSARDAFVYDRGFRAMRDVAYARPLQYATSDWHPDELYAAAWNHAVGVDDSDRALYGDLTTYLPNQLLAKADVSAMAFGLETRSPFLAREIVEYAATLPTSLRLHRFHTKYLLKKVAERYVPRAAIYRRKRGFVIPASRWLRTDLAPYVTAALDTPQFLDRGWIRADTVRQLIREHQQGTRDWTDQLWTLLVLEVWARLTLDGSLTPGDPLDVMLDRARS